MLIFRSIVCLFLVTCGYAKDFEPKAFPRAESFVKSEVSNNVVVRAESQDNKLRFDHVDEVSFVVDSELNPFLKVEGRVCLKIEGNGWCDMLQYLFSLPSDNFKVKLKTVDKIDIMEVVLRKDGNLILIGESVLTNEGLQSIELGKNIILFYDKFSDVPALMWLAPSEESYYSRTRKALFDQLHDNMM